MAKTQAEVREQRPANEEEEEQVEQLRKGAAGCLFIYF